MLFIYSKIQTLPLCFDILSVQNTLAKKYYTNDIPLHVPQDILASLRLPPLIMSCSLVVDDALE
jgi:hypothetical protein